MNTAIIRRKLVDYIRDADAQKVRAIYTLIEDKIEEDGDIWKDEFVTEMIRRKDEYKADKAKGHSWEEVQKRAIHQLNSHKK
ncbi:MAG: addiction module protein [Chitinophagaceae bacterium]